MTDNLLDKLNKKSIVELTAKESTKNKLDDAHENELIKLSENRSRLGEFAVTIIIVSTSILGIYLAVIIGREVCFVISDQAKLEHAIMAMYSGFTKFITDFQSAIAVIGTLIFGDKFKNKDK